MKVAIYARVSTGDQNAETQINEIKKYCEFKGWTDFSIFVDQGVSGTKTSRPEFDRMIACAAIGDIDIVAVWRFDRASRSTKHLLSLLEDFEKWGVDFVSVREQIDTSTATGKLMFTMVSAFAQFERDVISDRTKAGMRTRKAEGKHMGRKASVDHDEIRTRKKLGESTKSLALFYKLSESHIRRIVRPRTAA